MSEEILQPNTPVKFAARNMRPRFRRLKSGDIFLVEYEVEESVWNSLRTVPENALLETVMWHHDGDGSGEPVISEPEPKPEKPKKERGIYGGYWNKMFANSFYAWPDLAQVLNCTQGADQVRECLHGTFETGSLTFIGPRQFEKWGQEQGLPEGLITLSRNCEAWAAKDSV